LIFTHGRLTWLVGHWQGAGCLPLLSHDTAAELLRILAYPKFRLTAEEQLEALANYIPFCESVQIEHSCSVLCRDTKDQPLLDLAHSGKAEALVTGDGDLLALSGQTTFAIETPEAYRSKILQA
jgi:putative PIN family toxin of toxin-antitoxin system